MPKPIRELEKKRRPLEERVHEFLVQDRENAYTLNEIVAFVEAGDSQATRNLALLVLQMASSEETRRLRSQYEEALEKLIDRNLVRTFPEGSVTYYAAGNPA